MILNHIREMQKDRRRTYGSPRVQAELRGARQTKDLSTTVRQPAANSSGDSADTFPASRSGIHVEQAVGGRRRHGQ
jgi:hypothetical protein